MPIIDVTYDDTVDESLLRKLGQLLPDVVAEGVDCPEDPNVGPPSVEILRSDFGERAHLMLEISTLS
jgi:hypothetical protein